MMTDWAFPMEDGMIRNMGWLDRGLRLVAAAVLALVAVSTGMGGAGVLHWVLLAVAAIFALTAIVGVCPLYGLVGLRTCRTR